MNDFIVSWAISTILTFIRLVTSGNPTTKDQYKRALLKVRNAIDALYLEDTE